MRSQSCLHSFHHLHCGPTKSGKTPDGTVPTAYFKGFEMGQMNRIIRSHLCQLSLLLVSFISCESFASQVDALQAAMAYPRLSKTIPTISKIEVVGAYHCPDCYDIRIAGFDDMVAVQMIFRTLTDSRNQVQASLVSVERAP